MASHTSSGGYGGNGTAPTSSSPPSQVPTTGAGGKIAVGASGLFAAGLAALAAL